MILSVLVRLEVILDVESYDYGYFVEGRNQLRINRSLEVSISDTAYFSTSKQPMYARGNSLIETVHDV